MFLAIVSALLVAAPAGATDLCGTQEKGPLWVDYGDWFPGNHLFKQPGITAATARAGYAAELRRAGAGTSSGGSPSWVPVPTC